MIVPSLNVPIIVRPVCADAWLNGNCGKRDTVQTRWPLHPKPRPRETLEEYVRRLADCYGARYPYFCLRALGIPANDCQARLFDEPTPELLRRLSDGTGVSVGHLEQMTFTRVWSRLINEIDRYAATPEGQAALGAFLSQWPSQNS